MSDSIRMQKVVFTIHMNSSNAKKNPKTKPKQNKNSEEEKERMKNAGFVEVFQQSLINNLTCTTVNGTIKKMP